MNSYDRLRDEQQKRVNEFLNKYCFFAFSKDQFSEGMKKLGIDPEQTGVLVSIGGGGYLLKDHAKEYKALAEQLAEEQKTAEDDPENGDQFIFDMFYSELNNHEYSYTGDPTDACEALGYTLDEVRANDRLLQGLKKAARQCLADAE